MFAGVACRSSYLVACKILFYDYRASFCVLFASEVDISVDDRRETSRTFLLLARNVAESCEESKTSRISADQRFLRATSSSVTS